MSPHGLSSRGGKLATLLRSFSPLSGAGIPVSGGDCQGRLRHFPRRSQGAANALSGVLDGEGQQRITDTPLNHSRLTILSSIPSRGRPCRLAWSRDPQSRASQQEDTRLTLLPSRRRQEGSQALPDPVCQLPHHRGWRCQQDRTCPAWPVRSPDRFRRGLLVHRCQQEGRHHLVRGHAQPLPREPQEVPPRHQDGLWRSQEGEGAQGSHCVSVISHGPPGMKAHELPVRLDPAHFANTHFFTATSRTLAPKRRATKDSAL